MGGEEQLVAPCLVPLVQAGAAGRRMRPGMHMGAEDDLGGDHTERGA